MHELALLTDPIRTILKQTDVPGLAMALVRGAQDIEIACFGVKKHGDTDPITPESLFSAMSITKPVFAYAVLKLVERGMLSLDAPLDGYLPEPYLPGVPEAAKITTRHVLSHQTGFPNWRGRGEPLTLLRPPGTGYGYSGEGFVYLQKVVERVTGQPVDALLREMVFEPFGLRDGEMVWKPSMADRVVWGHTDDREWELDQEPEANGAFSLYTTIHDMARFVQVILFEHSDDPADPRLSSKSIKAMFSVQARVEVDDRKDLFWGLGWGLQSMPAGSQFWHYGASPGYRNYIAGSDAHHQAVILLTNGEDGLLAAQRICALLGDSVFSPSHPALEWLLLPHEV